MVSILSVRPNIFLGTCEGSTQYKKWYFEMMVDQVEPFVTAQASHLRVGWALTEGYSPYPGGGEGWGSNGVGDDLYSYGFDGLHLWSGSVCSSHSGGPVGSIMSVVMSLSPKPNPSHHHQPDGCCLVCFRQAPGW